MTEVYLFKIPDITDECASRLLAYVSAERRGKIQRLKDRNKQVESLFAALLVRAVLCQRLGVTNDRLEFKTTGKGKPFLQGSPDVHFSLSHTEGLVAAAVSDRPVGVDAEAVRPVDPKLVGRYFSEAEQEFVKVDSDGWLRRFFTVWTRKEAYVKRSGEGLTTPLRSFSVVGDADSEFKTLTAHNCTVSVTSDGGVRFVSDEETERILKKFLSESGFN